ncbi:GNAT family N-acetyltransferase [Chitinibacter bivalviorum]|uniref:GNAT family N-acetyltransferase n=1 Tax=Chitinibacter bivalviorum TaxID=2739434 RepID=A0A7H9BK57_9NEIS|nr:GNAT family N-acetyltransferase [Chitinibacter bivalviorum]QLG89065.1 GNAT family N-acetyltransferase [Chitinibacter bivalviorum]
MNLSRNALSCRTIEYGSCDWQSARELRYALFFAELGLPITVLDDAFERDAIHFAAFDRAQLVAYGRLALLPVCRGQISQMVVAPDRQGQGAGNLVLQGLIAIARQAGLNELILNARVFAQDFYAKEGFDAQGAVYVSPTTGVPHIKMHLELSSPASIHIKS